MRLTRQAALAIALICGLFAAVLAWMYIGKQSKPKQPAIETVEVPVPIKTIPAWLNLQPEMFRKVSFEKAKLPPNVILTTENLTGRISLTELPEGQPVLGHQVEVRSKKLGLAFGLKEGLRAMAISVDVIGAVGDFVKPGNFVDVLASFEKDGQVVVRTVTQNVAVLAVGMATSVAPPAAENGPEGTKEGESAPPRRTETPITLALTPTQAQLVLTADVAGDIRLVLRAMGDAAVTPMPNSNSWSMIGPIPKAQSGASATAATPPPPAPQPMYGPQGPQDYGARPAPPTTIMPKKPSVEVIRGGQREIVTPE